MPKLLFSSATFSLYVFTAQTMMPTGVLLFVSETSAIDERGLVLKRLLQGKENKLWTNFSHSLKSLNLGLPVIGKQQIKSYTTKYPEKCGASS